VPYEFDAKWTTDLDISYALSSDMTLSLGGINVFDTKPSKWGGLDGIGFGNNGILPYSTYTPLNNSGAYYYLQSTVRF